MSLFTQMVSPITGKSDWKSECEDYDYHQEVARAAFADMLHDTERNKKYFLGLKKTIENIHLNGLKAHVLDIGTGTGILSMMAVKCGADKVTACEAFKPMANCAEKIMIANGMKDKINLIKKRSTDIKLGETNDCDMSERANVLVTELFDTELIGENAIGIFNHAHKYLLTDDCIVIPDTASVYVQIVECPLALAWSTPKLIANLDGETLLKTPKSISLCNGEAALHDLQLSQLSPHDFKTIVEPFSIFDFDFSSKKPLAKNRTKDIAIKSASNGVVQVVFFWWDIKMDQEGEIILSCAPYWTHPDFHQLSKERLEVPIQNCIPWRDHWMQSIYYLPNPLMVTKNQDFFLNANHDEYSFWFDVKPTKNTNLIDRHCCNCAFHLAYSRNRIGQLNQNRRNKKYFGILEEIINTDSQILILSEGSLLGLSTAVIGAKNVVCYEPNRLSNEVIESYTKTNKLENVKIVKNLEEIKDFKIFTHIFAEPYFSTSILPWDNFYFGTLLNKIKNQLNENINIIPFQANVMAVPVQFLDLHKIRIPLGICEGFDLTIFDKLIEKSSKLSDAMIEAQPLWEYPCKALGKPQKLFQLNFKDFENELNDIGNVPIEINGTCNGIALWVDWCLDNSNSIKTIVSTGPTETIEIGEFIKWDMYTRQGVHLIPNPINVNSANVLKWNINFNPTSGDFKLKYDFV